MKIYLKDIKPGKKTERDSKDIDGLAESIKEIGMNQPIIINEEKEIIAGRRRYFACKELGLEKVDVIFSSLNSLDQQLAKIDDNLTACPLGELETDLALMKRKEVYEKKYPQTVQYASKGTTAPYTERAAEIMNVSRRTIEKSVRRVVNAAPELNDARREGKINANAALQLVRLSKPDQRKLIPVVFGKNIAEIKDIVDTALNKNIAAAVKIAEQEGPSEDFLAAEIGRVQTKLMELYDLAVKAKSRYGGTRYSGILENAGKLKQENDRFLDRCGAQKQVVVRRQNSEKMAEIV